MERVNGLVVQAVKSKGKPDENIANKLELDTLCSLLPFTMDGMDMDLILSRKEFTDKDGRLLIHRLLRYIIRDPDEFDKSGTARME